MASPGCDVALDLYVVADGCLISSHRLTEWVSNAPTMEEDVAIANIALDLLGQARGLYAVLGDEDQLAYFRDAGDWRNPVICELPNGDFAHTMLRLHYVSDWLATVWPKLATHGDERVRGVAEKAIKENAYHRRHASTWITRLDDGTEESHRRLVAATNELAPYLDGFGAPASHTPHLAELLAEMQSLARAHPGASW